MSFKALFAIRGEDIGIVILPLAGKDFPLIETLGAGFEMPFPEERSAVAVLLKDFGESLLVAIEFIPIVHEAVLVAVLSGEDDGPAGSADRIGTEAVFEKHSLSREPIDIGRGINAFEPSFVGSDGMRSVIVGENEDDVGLFRRR